jgi:hypothetical protein
MISVAGKPRVGRIQLWPVKAVYGGPAHSSTSEQRESNLVIRLHDLSSYLVIDESLYSSSVAGFGTIDTEQDASGPA